MKKKSFLDLFDLIEKPASANLVCYGFPHVTKHGVKCIGLYDFFMAKDNGQSLDVVYQSCPISMYKQEILFAHAIRYGLAVCD